MSDPASTPPQPRDDPPFPEAGGPAPDPPPVVQYARGVGILLQTTGFLLFLSHCCVCSMAGAWDPAADRPAAFDMLSRNAVPDYSVTGLMADPGAAGVMITLFFGVAGGLGMCIFGLGMQTAKPRAALAAAITSFATLLVFLFAGVALWTGHAPFAMRIWHALMTALLLFTAGLTGAAWFALRDVDPSWFTALEPATEADEQAGRRHGQADPPPPATLEALQRERRRLAEQQARLDAIERTLQARDHNPSDGPGDSPPGDRT